MILRMIKCDICGREEREAQPNEGWPGWGALQGVALNGVNNPSICPAHLATVAEFVDSLTEDRCDGMD